MQPAEARSFTNCDSVPVSRRWIRSSRNGCRSLGVRIQQNLVGAQRVFDAGLIFGKVIILFIGILQHESGLREDHRREQCRAVFLIAPGQLVENHALIHMDVWNLNDPNRQPLLLQLESGIEGIGLEMVNVLERLLPFLGS